MRRWQMLDTATPDHQNWALSDPTTQRPIKRTRSLPAENRGALNAEPPRVHPRLETPCLAFSGGKEKSDICRQARAADVEVIEVN
jgi:hypothetical protein